MKKSTVVTLVELCGALLYCWWLYSEITESQNMEAKYWYYISRFCQSIAAYFGGIGLLAENEYHKAMQESRGY